MTLSILRGVFLLLVASVAALYLLSNQSSAELGYGMFSVIMFVSLLLAGGLVLIDLGFQRKRLSAISGIFLGLLAGLLAAYALSFVVDLIGLLTAPNLPFDLPLTPAEYERLSLDHKNLLASREAYLNLLQGVKVLIGLITCYFGISLVIQTKDDFRFVIPYVEFSKQIRGNRPTLLDSSVIIDGRIVDIVDTRVMQGTLVVPKFILNELQTIADSSDKLRRARGRRGLEILQKLQESHIIEVLIDEREPEGGTVDQKLIALAQQMQARVMTNDYNLNKIATLRGVDVINLNDLAKAMRPVVLPGEHMTVKLVKPGESPSQGVGYLDDGTMVVVEHGRDFLNQEIDLVVTSTLQTSAGRMIFGRYEPEDGEGGEHAASTGKAESSTPGEASQSSDTSADSGIRRISRPSGRNPRRR